VLPSLTDEVQKLRDEIDQACVDASAKKHRRYRKLLTDGSDTGLLCDCFNLTNSFSVLQTTLVCLCGSLAQCALSLKRSSAGPGFNPQTRQNKLFQHYWRACFEINFSDRCPL